jgi:hypothetical protein
MTFKPILLAIVIGTFLTICCFLTVSFQRYELKITGDTRAFKLDRLTGEVTFILRSTGTPVQLTRQRSDLSSIGGADTSSIPGKSQSTFDPFAEGLAVPIEAED